MLQKLKITHVSKSQVDTQYGLKDKVGIKTEQYGDKWLSCFMNKGNERSLGQLKEGAVVELMVEQKGDYMNFRPVSELDKVILRVEKLEDLAGIGKNDAPVQEAPAEEPQKSPEPEF